MDPVIARKIILSVKLINIVASLTKALNFII